jgi:hypothetical protein
MGAAYYIVLERKIDGLDSGMNGKSLSDRMDSLDGAAARLGVRPLSKFFSADPEQVAELMEDIGEIELPPLEQFSAQDGLTSVRALMADAVVWPDEVMQDLRECERILSVAAQHGVGWHFAIDF